MGFLPGHADTLFRLARSFASRQDQSENARKNARIALSKFSWKGVERDGTDLKVNKLYGLLACGVYMIYLDEIDAELLSELLLIMRDIPAIRPGNFDFCDEFVIFPEMEKITFLVGLVLTDLVRIPSPHQTKILSSVSNILDSYLKVIKSDIPVDDIGFSVIPGMFGLLRGFGKMENGFKRIFPLHKIGEKIKLEVRVRNKMTRLSA